MSVSQSGHIYVVWSDNRGGTPQIYINTSFPGTGWIPRATPINTGYPRPLDLQSKPVIGEATAPGVCSDSSGHVYVVWVDDRAVKAGKGKRDIYFRYSKDYGITWYPEFIDYQLDSDNPDSQIVGDSINPQIACDGNGNVYVAWEDDRDKAGTYEVYFRSLQVQFSKPIDFIVPYQYPEIRLNTGVESGRFAARSPVISTDKAGTVYAVWQDDRNIPEDDVYNGIYFNISRNHGATWKSEASRVDTAPVGYYQSISPVISNDSSGRVYVAWLDNAGRVTRGDEFAGDGTYDVYFNSSRDYGDKWGEEDERIDTPGKRIEAIDVAIASNSKGVVTIVWADNRDATSTGVSTNYNIYFNHSEDSGKRRSFRDSYSNIRIDTGVAPGITYATNPTVQVDTRGNVFVAWLDKRTTTVDIFFNFSIEKGREGSWQASDIRVDYPVPDGDSSNQIMSIDDLGHVYLAWQDTKSALAEGNYNVYFISGFLDIETLIIAGQRVGKACFIATAAYGSPFHGHVEILREFRDRYLLSNAPGRWFVASYYRVSPPIAHFISGHSYLRAAVRMALLPAVGMAALHVYTTTLHKIALIMSLILIIGAVRAYLRLR